jgi:hypothetical protein
MAGLDLTTLTPEQLASLRAQLGLPAGDASGRSPFRPRQLHDLRLLPTAEDPRPTFFWSAVSPRDVDVTTTSPYPRLLWNTATDEEVTVGDLETHQAYLAEGYTEQAPMHAPVDPMAEIEAALAALSVEERAMVVESQRKQRVAALTEKMAGLSDGALASLLSDAPKTEKRKPGRPRKSDAA